MDLIFLLPADLKHTPLMISTAFWYGYDFDYEGAQ